MRIEYANYFIVNMVLGDTTNFFYQFISNDNDSNYTKIIKYFITHRLGLRIKFDSFVAHMLYAWSFINNTALSIGMRKNIYFISLNKSTTVVDCRASNFNKNRT